MFLLSVRWSVSCLLIITLTGLLQIINAESFRPIFNPNVPLRPTAKKLTANIATTTSTTTTTVRPLTTISATLKSRVLLTKQQASSPSSSQQHQAVRAPIKSLAPSSVQTPPSPQSTVRKTNDDVAASDVKDAPVAEALRGNWRRWRRPYYYPASNLLPNPRYRRRPNPKPYYAPPGFGYGAPYEDYRFETDFLGTNAYVPKSKPKFPVALEAGKGYAGLVDTDIGAFYDSQSATYNVPPLKNYDTQSSSYYSGGSSAGSSGLGTSFGTGLGGTSLGSIHSAAGQSTVLGAGYSAGGGKGSIATGIGSSSGTALANLYSDYGDTDLDYKFSTSKPKTNYKNLPSRAPIKQSTKTRTKYNYNDDEYRYSSGDTSHYGISSLEGDDGISDPKTVAKYNNIYLPQHTIYQTPPKKSKQRPTKPKTTTTTSTTTYTPPIKISDTSIDVLTKPLGSATFNLNLSPGNLYNPQQQPPSINYNQPSNNYKSVQPIPLQPPSTNYGVPVAPPLNAYTYQNQYQNQYQNSYQNSYQNQYNPSYPASTAQNNNGYVDPASISITNDLARTPGPFAEPPPLNQQTLSNVDVSYNSVQSSYDATPKNTRPTKRKPTKVNSKRVSTKRPALNLDEELTDDEQNTEQSDYYGESYSFYKTMPQPSLPNTYDQDDFHTVKNKRKQLKQAANGYEREERSRTTKKPRQPIEVTLRIPDEDYLDDLVKVVQTTKRPKKKSKPTTSHNLDTEDLRDAYENNSAYYAKKKVKSPRYTTQQPNEYDDNYDDDNDDDEYENDRLSNVNSKEDTKSSSDTDLNADGSQNSPYWDKDSSIYKQYGIRARNDNFASGGSGYEIHSYNNGFRPIRNDHSKTYVALNHPSDVRAPYVQRDIAPLLQSHNFVANGNRIATTLHSITTTTTKPPSTLFVWNGGELPKNHKMA